MTSGTRRLLAGRFALDTRIGAGNYAEVFRATDTLTRQLVAVKTLRPEHVAEAETLSLFRKEGAAGAAIVHPNVVRIMSFGESHGTHYIVMELVKGISLRRRLKLAGPLGLSESLDTVIGILRGLEAIHDAGYVHRDIKPQNILIDANGTPKITDFGITLCPGESRACANGLALGTAAYIAPEQAAGQEVGPQADIYSAGVVLFEMLTGEPPFPGDDPIEVMNRHLFEPPRDPRAMNAKISPALSAIVMRALAKEPAARFGSAGRMREALEMLRDERQRLSQGRRRGLPRDKIAWTVPLAPTKHMPLKLANVPVLTTFVSALLLIVLIIVVMLALISSRVDASAPNGQITSSDPPSGLSETSTASTTHGQIIETPADVTTSPNLNWSVQAAATVTATEPTTQSDSPPTPTATPTPVPTEQASPVVVHATQQKTPQATATAQRPAPTAPANAETQPPTPVPEDPHGHSGNDDPAHHHGHGPKKPDAEQGQSPPTPPPAPTPPPPPEKKPKDPPPPPSNAGNTPPKQPGGQGDSSATSGDSNGSDAGPKKPHDTNHGPGHGHGHG